MSTGSLFTDMPMTAHRIGAPIRCTHAAGLDVYVWVEDTDRADAIARFVERYVDTDNPGDPRFEAFCRVFVTGERTARDLAVLEDLRRGDRGTTAFSLYLHARSHHEAVIALTEEGALVLGLGLDDPSNSPETLRSASVLMDALRKEFKALAAVAGVELPPAQTKAEWREDVLVQLRYGRL
jgi:hypothetical protein